jgi:microcystin-dependent protein
MTKNDSGNNRGEALIGMISGFDFSAPTNWLACDGSAISQTTYSMLYSIITNSYEGTLNLTSITSVAATGITGQRLDWHPSSNYVAMASANSAKEIAIYSFNGTTLTEAETVNLGTVSAGIAWHPNGNFLAATNTSGLDVLVYSWNGSDTLTNAEAIDVGAGNVTRDVDWHPDGNFLAVCTAPGGANGLINIYSWNGSDTLTEVESISLTGKDALMPKWSNDGNYLAVATNVLNEELRVYSWNGSDTLALVDTGDNNGGYLYTCCWTIDDKYIFIGGSADAHTIAGFSFNGTTLTEVVYKDYGATTVGYVNMSRGSKYLLVSYFKSASPSYNVIGYLWDPSTETLTEIDTIAGTGTGSRCVGTNYTNNYIAYGGDAEDIVIFAGTTGLTSSSCDWTINFLLPTVTDNIIRAL